MPLVEPMSEMSKYKPFIDGRRTGSNLNSFERAKTLNSSNVDIVGRKCWL